MEWFKGSYRNKRRPRHDKNVGISRSMRSDENRSAGSDHKAPRMLTVDHKSNKYNEDPIRARERENEELSRFYDMVMKKVTDVVLLSSRPDSAERIQMRYIARISYYLLSSRINEELQNTEASSKALEWECGKHLNDIENLTRSHREEIARLTEQRGREVRQANEELDRGIKQATEQREREVRQAHDQRLKEAKQANDQRIKEIRQADDQRHREIGQINEQWEQKFSQLKCKHEASLAKKNGYIMDLKSEHTNQIGAYDNRIGEMAREIKATAENRDEQINALAQDHANNIKNLERQMKEDNASNIRQLENQVRQQAQVHAHRLRELEDRIKAQAEDHADYVEDLESRMNEAHAKTLGDFQDRFDEQARDHANRVRTLEDRMSDQAEEHESAINTMKQEHNDELADTKEIHSTQISDLVVEHAGNTKNLRAEVHGLKQVLLKRDDDPYLAKILSIADTKQEPDEHIRAEFLEVKQLVDNLSSLAIWKPEQGLWTDELLGKVCHSPATRSLKKRILQDLIWTLLHHYIFCSPFRMFGEEGEKLEKEWIGNYGKGSLIYTVPPDCPSLPLNTS